MDTTTDAGMDTTMWHGAISSYTMAMRSQGLSEASIVLYRHCLRQAATHLGGRPWSQTYGDLESLLGSRTWGPSARKSLRSALVGFYRWGARRGYVDADPAAELPGIRVRRGLPRPAPESVVLATLERADDRTRLMVELAVFAGLRAGEVARVHRDDLSGDVLTVQGKGGKQRWVPIGADLQTAIASAPGWVFPSPRGGHLTPNHVSKLIAQAMPEGWTAHTLRHRFGTRAYQGTRDLLAVSELLGHASTETTKIYVQMPMDHMRSAVAAAATVGALQPAA